MATTTNYSWTTPDDTALVKDGAAAIRSLGSAIDTTVFNNANAAIAKTIVDAKGDIIAATAADTVAILAVGANDTVLTADSSTATGLKWATPASGGAYTQLASGSLPAGTLTFSSISSAYVDLRLIILASRTGSNGDFYRMRFNNDTGNNYCGTSAYNDNPQVFQNAQMNVFGIGQNSAAANGAVIVEIPNYTNTSIWKTARSYAYVNNQNTSTDVGFAHNNLFWNGTAAINRIDVYPFTGTFATGTYILYGVK